MLLIKRSLGLQRWRLTIVAFCVLFFCRLLVNATEILHFDLQQDGAAALVIVNGPDGKARYVLIDTGRRSADRKGASLVRDELRKRDIKRLDLVILTHLDADHAEGIFTLLGTTKTGELSPETSNEPIRGPPLEIKRILVPADTLPQHERFREQLVSAATISNAEVVSPTTAIIEEIEKTYSVTVLVPPSKPKARPNETSLVIVGYDRQQDSAFMFTGDLPASMIRQMLPKLPNHVDVLQAPHHGADPGLLALVAKTRPNYIVISADKGNRYAHPRLSILRSLAAIRPPPSRSAIIRDGGIDDPDRFGAARLAREVEKRLSTAISKVKRNSPGFDINSGAWSSQWSLTPTPNRERSWRTVGRAFDYEQVLITGERGDLQFVDGLYTGTADVEQSSFMSLVWYELQYVSDEELQELRTWNEAQAYLSIIAAARVRDYQPEPDKVTVPNSGLPLVKGTAPKRLPAMKRSQVIKIGKTRVMPKRWNELLQKCAEQSVAAREAALRGVREKLLQWGSAEEVSLLIAAAVADYETDGGDRHLTNATKSINRQREIARDEAISRARQEIVELRGRAKPQTGWLAPALVRLGLPKGLSAFSGAVLEAAAETRPRLRRR